ncbi:hypothetical protein T4D_15345 [Trichinella pseudospiralis]|uniref:Uncharacterized protein n=1 Tax=Trichinella pseudospiralis TaxID=6337 RepID=A0A0V1G2E6_TRIPS|nr:hypothetical protein T4D_15345 [Trichinella pseudospiralis]
MNQSTIFRQFTFHEQAFLISERFVLHGFHPIKLCLVQFFYGQFFLPLLRWMSTILRKPEAPCRHSSQFAEGLETRRVNNILILVVIDRRYPAEQRSLFKRGSGFNSDGGPSHHNRESFNFVTLVPRLIKSAGLFSDGQYFHSFGSFFASLRIQLKTILLSVQQMTRWIGTAKLFLMKPTNLAAIKAAISSNRGRVIVSKGATLDFDMINLTVVLSLLMTFRYATAP